MNNLEVYEQKVFMQSGRKPLATGSDLVPLIKQWFQYRRGFFLVVPGKNGTSRRFATAVQDPRPSSFVWAFKHRPLLWCTPLGTHVRWMQSAASNSTVRHPENFF